ncbi:unnamed protein product, partial [Timema podura]|nr:unnamed protein product [Timema podura]
MNEKFDKPHTYYLSNHVDLKVTYHSGEGEDWGVGFHGNSGRIISVKVVPRSIHHKDPNKPDCSGKDPVEIPSGNLKAGEKLNITYTYSITFEVSIHHLQV